MRRNENPVLLIFPKVPLHFNTHVFFDTLFWFIFKTFKYRYAPCSVALHPLCPLHQLHHPRSTCAMVPLLHLPNIRLLRRRRCSPGSLQRWQRPQKLDPPRPHSARRFLSLHDLRCLRSPFSGHHLHLRRILPVRTPQGSTPIFSWRKSYQLVGSTCCAQESSH